MNDTSRARTAALTRVRDKRTAILDAALRLFAEGGVNGVPMPAVAQAAGVGTGTVYRYFDSKDTLVNELYREQKAAFNRCLYAELGTALAPRELFGVVWQRMIEFGQQQPASFRFIEMQDHRPYLDQASRELERRSLAPGLAHYRALQEQGIFRADVRPEVLLALVWGAYVNLVKAERDGYLVLTQADIEAACAAAWSLCTG